MRTRILVIAVALVALAAGPAAASMEYYTWGGFNAVDPAFRTIANIFSDSNYSGMFTAFALFGGVFGALGVYLKAISGRGNPAAWLIPLLVGAIIYFGLFVPKSTLFLYDNVMNQTASYDLPVGVVYTAGTVNLIERFVVQTMDTNATLPPSTTCGPLAQLNYADQGGAVGLTTLQSTLSSYVTDSNATQSIVTYVSDCVTFELQRPGTSLTFNNLMDPGCGQTFIGVIGAAASPANRTTSYLPPSDPAGTTMSCQDAYNALNTYFTNAGNTNQYVQMACGSSNFVDMGQCQNVVSQLIQGSLGYAIDPASFVGMNSLAFYTDQTLKAGGTSSLQYVTMTNQAQSGTAGGWMTGIMNPLLIDTYVAYSFMVLPLLALFVVTPLFQQAITLMLGMLFWTALLRALDVITFHMWVNQYQQTLAAALNNAGQGIAAMLQMPTEANKYLGSFAQMRGSVFLLATVISGMLWKFGDSALSRLAAQARSDTNVIEKAYQNPHDRGKLATDNMASEHRTEAMMQSLKEGRHSFNNFGAGVVAAELAGAAGGMGKMDAGGSYGGAFDQSRQKGKVEAAQGYGYARGLQLDQALMQGGTESAGVRAKLDALGAFNQDREGQAYQNAYVSTMGNTAASMTTRDVVQDWAKQAGISDKDSYQGYAAMDMANRQGVMRAWGGDVGSYAKFLENSQYLSRGERDAVMMAAGAAGLDLRDFAKDRATIDKMKDVGMIQAMQEGKIDSNDLRAMGHAGILTDAGRMDQWKAVQEMTGMGPREATAFVGAHGEMKSIAGYGEAEKYAAAHNKNYMDLMRAGARSFRMDLSAQEAKGWGLGGREGTYMVALGQDGRAVFVDERSGQAFQRGTFGKEGRQLADYNVHEKITSHGDVLNGQTLLQMSMKGDPAAVIGVGDEKLTGKPLDAAIAEVSSQTAGALAPIIAQTGRNANEVAVQAAAKAGFGVQASEGFKIAGSGVSSSQSASMEGSLVAAGTSSESWAYNRIQNIDAKVLMQARHEAASHGYHGKQFTNYVAQRHSAFVNNMVGVASSKQGFGVQYGGQIVKEIGTGVGQAAKSFPGAAKEAFPVVFKK